MTRAPSEIQHDCHNLTLSVALMDIPLSDSLSFLCLPLHHSISSHHRSFSFSFTFIVKGKLLSPRDHSTRDAALSDTLHCCSCQMHWLHLLTRVSPIVWASHLQAAMISPPHRTTCAQAPPSLEDPISTPHLQPQNSEFLTKDFRLQPGLDWKFLLSKNLVRRKTAPAAVSGTVTPLLRRIRFPW